MKNVAMDTKAAPALARTVSTGMAQLLAWVEDEKLPAMRPAKSIGSAHLHPTIRAYAAKMIFSIKYLTKRISLSYNIAMQPTPATLGRASLAASQSADGGRYALK